MLETLFKNTNLSPADIIFFHSFFSPLRKKYFLSSVASKLNLL